MRPSHIYIYILYYSNILTTGGRGIIITGTGQILFNINGHIKINIVKKYEFHETIPTVSITSKIK